MSLVLDVILVAIFAAFVFAAAKRGFMKALLELVAVVAALFLAYQLSPVVSQSIYDGFVEEKIVASVQEQLDKAPNASKLSENIEVTVNAIPEFFTKAAESVGVDMEKVKSSVINSADLDSSNMAQDLTEKVAKPVVTGILTVLLFVLLAVILLIVLRIIADMLAKLFKIPIAKTVNRALGGVLGAVKGVLVVVLICTVLKLLFAGGDGEISEAVSNSYVIGLLDNINPFIDALKELV